MNKQELAAKISEAKGITKVEATRVVDAVFETIVEELKAGEMVKIPGLETLLLKQEKQEQLSFL